MSATDSSEETQRRRQRRFWKLEDRFKPAREFAKNFYGVDVDFDRLDDAEWKELAALVDRVHHPIEADQPSIETVEHLHRIEEYAANVEALAETTTNPELRDRALFDAKAARQLGRVPKKHELERLRAGDPPSAFRGPVSFGYYPRSITEEETTRMQSLIEKAAGVPGLFAARAAQAKIQALAARAAMNRPRSTASPARGGVVLPLEVYNDIAPTETMELRPDVPDFAKQYIEWGDVAVLWSIVAILQSQRLPIGSNTRFEDDGNTLVIQGVPFRYADKSTETWSHFNESLERLGQTRSKWLHVERMNGGATSVPVLRIKIGVRGLRYGLGDGIPKKKEATS